MSHFHQKKLNYWILKIKEGQSPSFIKNHQVEIDSLHNWKVTVLYHGITKTKSILNSKYDSSNFHSWQRKVIYLKKGKKHSLNVFIGSKLECICMPTYVLETLPMPIM